MFPDDPPIITFTKDFHQEVHGDLRPGRTVTLNYDAERLPNERSEEGGQKAWTIKAFCKFEERGEVHNLDLWSESGKILHKITDEPGEGTMMIGRIDLPDSADHLTIWFLNTGKSGAECWDSNEGCNYIFRFVVEDLHVVAVGVIPDDNAPLSWFRIDVMALDEVDEVVISYRVMNDPAGGLDRSQPLTPGTIDGNERHWTGSAPVPEHAVVRFTLGYSAYGVPHTDTNSGKGYLTWTDAKRNIEMGVL
jgi:hypothetical protein